jgi:hypothetical protein
MKSPSFKIKGCKEQNAASALDYGKMSDVPTSPMDADRPKKLGVQAPGTFYSKPVKQKQCSFKIR